MADLANIILILVIAFDLAVSVWNAYASGLTWTLLRGQPGQRFAKAAAIAGLGLAFAGMSYATIVVLSFLAYFTGFLAVGDLLFVLSFDFLVFGAMIIGFGLVVTAQSIAVAYHERNFGAIATAIWNVFSEIWDISIYAEGFHSAASAVSGEERDRTSLYAIIAVALGIAFIITFVAYRRGVEKAERILEAYPDRTPAPSAGTPGSGPPRPVRHAKTVVIVGVVAVMVVIAAIVAVAFAPRTSPMVKVLGMNVWAPDNVCGLSANPISYSGFQDALGASQLFALEIPNYNATSCSLHGATTNTSGFGLANVQVPVTVSGLHNGTLNLTIVLPGSTYSGVLNLVYS